MVGSRYSIIPVFLFIAFVFGSSGLVLSQVRPGIQTPVVPPEGCYLDGSADADDLYSFIRVEIQALAFARDGEQADRDLLSAKAGPPIDKMAHLMTGLRNERIENACAGFVISPYAKSNNEYIASAAGYLVNAYGELGKITDEMLRLTMMETILQRSGGSTESEFASLKNKRQDLLTNMALAVDASLSLLLSPRLDSNGKHDRLVFTAAQRDDLLSYLYSKFPTLKDSRTKTDSSDFTGQVAHIRSYLSGKYKTSDQ